MEEDSMEFSTDQDAFFFADTNHNPPKTTDGSGTSSADGTLFGAEEGSVAWDAPLTLWTLPEIGTFQINSLS